jgi:hypothetical protein
MLASKERFESPNHDANHCKTDSSILNPGSCGTNDLYPGIVGPDWRDSLLPYSNLLSRRGLFTRISFRGSFRLRLASNSGDSFKGGYEDDPRCGIVDAWLQSAPILEQELRATNRKLELLYRYRPGRRTCQMPC